MWNEAIKAGGVAVITGGASGVGFAMAQECAARGLKLVLADVSESALADAAQELSLKGADIRCVTTDVSDAEAVRALADTAFDIGPVAVLMNNAGIAPPTKAWENADNWRRLMEVNLFGPLNGVQAFVPRMIDAGWPAVVINTGSKQGITTPPGNAGYNVSKASVKAMTEMLAHELREAKAPVSAHLFVPGFTYTGMIASFLPEKPAAAWTSGETVSHLVARLEQDDFYILCPDNEVTPEIDARRVAWAAQDIVQNRPALSRWHPDHAESFAAFEKSGRAGEGT
ncbi:SDR family NAD(P)-dependent oxidoreductase [Sulfitobacter sp. S190]|uniref:SDR family NAD(P)-dependent oxidoreductase n=1 Tax=Sulfitobacter sp. S190 TaxID=2867022 RepID=UPI0021A459CF|nr:SDR family NAD(P)-dependent oxidoreductase [Sulfitobacter sp. S190]UWR21754.1 SDR family NAD(P)-dependent oxidoreductase [Sulfitobacter sp. S190]